MRLFWPNRQKSPLNSPANIAAPGLKLAPSGRRKRFCSDACRQAAFRNETTANKAPTYPTKGYENFALELIETQDDFLSRNEELELSRSSARSSKQLKFEKQNEQRFRTPELLLEHGIRRAMNVILQGDGSPYGVLEVDSRSEGESGEHDIAFLQGAANILGMAIERQRYERHLKAALDRHQVLLREISHRVKNSLQIVSSMLHLQASTADDDSLIAQQLSEASNRVSAIGRAYERLAYDADFENIDLGSYLLAVCSDAVSPGSNCKLHFDGSRGIWLSADRAISLALIVNELVTNAVKYAFSKRHDGHIYVRLVRQDANTALVSVRDDGIGLAADFDLTKSKGLGMQIVTAFAKQLGADITRTTQGEGNEFVVSIPSEQISET
jgi:two-component sensor histidine kinase